MYKNKSTSKSKLIRARFPDFRQSGVFSPELSAEFLFLAE